MAVRLTTVTIAAGLLCSACSGGSQPTPVPTVTGVSVTGAASSPAPGDTAQLSATASFSDGTTQTVTSQAAWATTNASVATVSSSGLATFLSAGDADLKATYRGTTGTSHVTVRPTGPPRFQLSGIIMESGTTHLLTGVTVTVADGPDAGRSTLSDANGAYTLTGLTAGPFTLRLTRTDFEAQTVPVSLTADATLNLTMNLIANVSGFFGTYNTNLTILQQSCDFPFTVGPTGTINLNGQSNGTALTVTIVERGTTRTYSGMLRADGSFTGTGGGVIAGLAAITQGRANHEYRGDVSGTVTGRSISATENVVFTIPCPGATMKILYTGGR